MKYASLVTVVNFTGHGPSEIRFAVIVIPQLNDPSEFNRVKISRGKPQLNSSAEFNPNEIVDAFHGAQQGARGTAG